MGEDQGKYGQVAVSPLTCTGYSPKVDAGEGIVRIRFNSGGVQKSKRDVLTLSISCAPDAAPHSTPRTGTASTMWHPGTRETRALSRCGTRLALFQENSAGARPMFPTIHSFLPPRLAPGGTQL